MRSRTRQWPRATVAKPPALVGLESPLDELGLSVRTRNALHKVGCHTIEDTLRMDLSVAVRGFGSKAKDELLTALDQAGFHHRGLDQHPTSEMEGLERSLERMERRVDEALGAVAKEIRIMRQKLRKRLPERNARRPDGGVAGPLAEE